VRSGRSTQAVGHMHRVRCQRLPRLDEDERGVVQPQEQLPQGRHGEGACARRLCGDNVLGTLR
jgi:hypothetical protein